MSLSWNNVCRLCVNSEGCENIVFNVDGERKAILQLIEKYIPIISISRADFPTNVCRQCSDKLTGFHNFATQCERTQYFFEIHKNTILQDDIHLQFLKSEFELGENPIKIKNEDCEEDFQDDYIPNEDDDLDYLPLSDLRDIKKKSDDGKNKSSKKKRGRPRKKDVSMDDEKVFSELEKLMDGEMIDNSVDEFQPVTIKIRKRKDIKQETLRDENGDIICFKIADTEPKRKIKSRLKELQFEKVRKPTRKRNYGIFKFDCHVCEKEFSNWNALKLHAKRAHKTNAKVLCICFKYLTTRRSLLHHIAKHDPSKCFKCDSCDKIFGSKSALTNHALYHLPKDEYPYVCCKCAKRFTTSRILKSHEMTHVPREERFVLPCDLCEHKFATKGALITHKRVIHEKLKPYVCDLCGHAFGTKANLDEHRVRHGDEKNFVCNECKKSFKTKGALVRHLDTHGDTAYQCPHCPMLLNSRRTLRNHLFVHDSRAKHICPFCAKAFKRRKDVKGHVKLHTGERPYTCPWCPRTFTNGSNCRIHKRRMHPHEFQIAETVNPFAPTLGVKSEPKKVIHTTFRSNSIRNNIIIDTENLDRGELSRSDTVLKNKDSTSKAIIADEREPNFPICEEQSERTIKLEILHKLR